VGFSDLAYRLGALGKVGLWLLTLAAIAACGALDYFTGTEASFALFYLFPVAFAAWWIGRGAGVFCSVACAAVWHFANALAGQVYSTPLMSIWNSGIRFGFFLIVTVLLVRIHTMLRREREFSRTDFLTGAYNVRAFHEIAEAECQRASRYPQPLTLVYIDLDGFKVVNDRFGHDEGDRVLATTAKTLKAGIRKPDTLARLGGDEFALLLPQTDTASAQVLLPRLREQLLAAMQRNKWAVTFSIGAITCASAPASLVDVVNEADELMYEVKRAGRNAIRYGVYAGAARLGDAAAILTPEKGRVSAEVLPEGDT
jgi:diguanylate cyclase (GGDEF)-like protein